MVFERFNFNIVPLAAGSIEILVVSQVLIGVAGIVS